MIRIKKEKIYLNIIIYTIILTFISSNIYAFNKVSPIGSLVEEAPSGKDIESFLLSEEKMQRSVDMRNSLLKNINRQIDYGSQDAVNSRLMEDRFIKYQAEQAKEVNNTFSVTKSSGDNDEGSEWERYSGKSLVQIKALLEMLGLSEYYAEISKLISGDSSHSWSLLLNYQQGDDSRVKFKLTLNDKDGLSDSSYTIVREKVFSEEEDDDEEENGQKKSSKKKSKKKSKSKKKDKDSEEDEDKLTLPWIKETEENDEYKDKELVEDDMELNLPVIKDTGIELTLPWKRGDEEENKYEDNVGDETELVLFSDDKDEEDEEIEPEGEFYWVDKKIVQTEIKHKSGSRNYAINNGSDATHAFDLVNSFHEKITYLNEDDNRVIERDVEQKYHNEIGKRVVINEHSMVYDYNLINGSKDEAHITEITREISEEDYIKSSDDEWMVEKYHETIKDNRSPDKVTDRFVELTYNDDDKVEKKISVIHEKASSGLDRWYAVVEKDFSYISVGDSELNQPRKYTSIHLNGNFNSKDDAMNAAKKIAGLDPDDINPDNLSDGITNLQIQKINNIKYDENGLERQLQGYTKIVGKDGEDILQHRYDFEQDITERDDMMRVVEKTEKITNDSASPDKTTITTISDVEYNYKGMQVGYTQELAEKGKGLDHTVTTKRSGISYNELGLEKSYIETISDSASPDKITTTITSSIEYNEDGLKEGYTQQIHETSPALDRTITIEKKEIIYNNLNQMKGYTDVTQDSASPDKTTTTVTSGIGYNQDGFRTGYKQQIHETGKDLDHTVTIDKKNLSYNGNGQMKGYADVTKDSATPDKTTTTVTSGIGYNENGFREGYTQQVHETGKDLDHTVTIDKKDLSYNGNGQMNGYTDVTQDSASPDKTTTTTVTGIGYNQDSLEKGYTQQIHETGKGLDHTVTIDKKNLSYNGNGQMSGYTDVTQDSALPNKTTTTTVSGIGYNQDGLEKGYTQQIHETGEGLDHATMAIQSISYVESPSDTSSNEQGGTLNHTKTIEVSDIEYNGLGQKVSWDEKTYNDSAAPDKITNAHITVEYDGLGRQVSYLEKGHQTGSAAGGASSGLNNHYTLKKTFTYNGLGQITSYTEEYNGQDENYSRTVTDIKYNSQGQQISYHESGTNKDGSYSFDRTNMTYNGLGQITSYDEAGVNTDGDSYTSHTYNITYNSNGQRTGYEADSTVSGSETETSEDGSSTTTTTYTSHSHTSVRDMTYNSLGQLISYESDSTFDSTGHSSTTYEGYPGKKTETNYTSSGSSHTSWRATYDIHGTQHECGSKTSQSHSEGTSVTTDTATPGRVITTEFSRDYVNGQLTYSFETIHDTSTPGLTVTIEKTDIVYDKVSSYDWEEDEWDEGLMVGYKEVRHVFGEYVDEDGGKQVIDVTTVTERVSTTYNDSEQVTGYVEIITSTDTPGVTTRIEVTEIKYDDKGRMKSYKETRHEQGDGLDTTVTTERKDMEYNEWGQLISYTEIIQDSASPDKTTTVKVKGIQYNQKGQQESYIQEIIETGEGLNQTVILERSNIRYNDFGQIVTYTDKTENLASPGKTTITTVTDIEYNKDGLKESYIQEILETGEGLDHTVIIEKGALKYNDLGQIISYAETEQDSSSPDKTTKVTVSDIDYYEDGLQKSYHQEILETGEELDHTVILERGNIEYNNLGQTVSYTDTTEDSASLEKTTTTTVADVEYYENGLQKSYKQEIYVTGDGLDHTTTVERKDVEYNNLGQIISYVDEIQDSASPDKTTTSNVYNIEYDENNQKIKWDEETS